MIFLTVGTQLPFSRLTSAVDSVSMKLGLVNVFGQIADSNNIPANFESIPFLNQSDFSDYFSRAEIIISHAGMGSIIEVLTAGKKIIVMPRLASLNEHRNDHQVSTCNKLKGLEGLIIVNDESELEEAIKTLLSDNSDTQKISSYASEDLLDYINSEICGSLT